MMVPGLAPCRACGLQISIQAPACPRCGQPMPTNVAQAQAQKTQNASGLMFVVLLVGALLALWYGCNSFKESSKKYDADFCRENLAYYENFCTVYPNNCKEGPRKLAKCQ